MGVFLNKPKPVSITQLDTVCPIKLSAGCKCV